VASFGARLKQQREQKGVSLDDVAKSTKIGTRMLRALEQEQLDQLPGGIFNKGFIRAYARFLGIDEEEVIAEYAATTGAAQPEQRPGEDRFPLQDVKSEIERENSEGLPWGTFAAILVIAALLFAIWGVYARQKQNKAAKQIASEQAAMQPQFAPAAASTAVVPDHSAPPVANPPQPVAASAAQTSLAGGKTLQPPNAGATSAAAPTHDSAPEKGKIRVTVKAREDSWISITVDGEVTMQGTLTAGSQRNVQASREIAIKAGNAGALDFAFNGKDLPSQGAEGEVKSLVFNTNGLEPAVSNPEPQQP
jgi:cytoskeleton protein RodZ